MMSGNHEAQHMTDDEMVLISAQELQQLLDDAVLKAINEYRNAGGPYKNGTMSSSNIADILLAMGLPLPVSGLLHSAVEQFRGNSRTDEFGRDEHISMLIEKAMEFIYSSWFRYYIEGLEHVPHEGPVLFVANHGRLLPMDSLMIHHAVQREHPRRRSVCCLFDHWVNKLPFFGDIMRRSGHLSATKENGLRLLERGECVCVFPEGSEANRGFYPRPYRLHRFNRRDLLKTALQTGAPVVPCVILGADYTWSLPLRYDWVGAVLGKPFQPVTPQFPGFSQPLSPIPLPARWRIRFLAPVFLDASKGTTGITEEAYLDSIGQIIRERMQRILDAWSGNTIPPRHYKKV